MGKIAKGKYAEIRLSKSPLTIQLWEDGEHMARIFIINKKNNQIINDITINIDAIKYLKKDEW